MRPQNLPPCRVREESTADSPLSGTQATDRISSNRQNQAAGCVRPGIRCVMRRVLPCRQPAFPKGKLPPHQGDQTQGSCSSSSFDREKPWWEPVSTGMSQENRTKGTVPYYPQGLVSGHSFRSNQRSVPCGERCWRKGTAVRGPQDVSQDGGVNVLISAHQHVRTTARPERPSLRTTCRRAEQQSCTGGRAADATLGLAGGAESAPGWSRSRM